MIRFHEKKQQMEKANHLDFSPNEILKVRIFEFGILYINYYLKR